jgi:hypothetical protein
MRSLLVMWNPYPQAPEVSIVRTDTCMIGQRFPTADEPVSCITAIFAPLGLGCKDLI